MKESNINLYESTFPFNLAKNIKSIEGLENLGNLLDIIKVNFLISKIDANSFFLQGNIKAAFESECQRCSKLSPIDLDIKSKVGIKDKLVESSDQKISDDIHYQNLQSFNINILVREEIYLNFPSIFFCCTKEIEKGDNIIFDKKVRPFKKIRDLIK